MNEKTNALVKEIRLSFRRRMNGVVSKSMRDKGVAYKINWGISLLELREMAKTIDFDQELVMGLWKESIRECKILATLIASTNPFPRENVEIMMEEIDNQELAEMLAYNMIQHQSYAIPLAIECLRTDNNYKKICAYNTFSSLFTKSITPDNKDIDDIINQMITDIDGDNVGVKHAAYNCIIKFANLSQECYEKARKAITSNNLDVFL